MRSVRISGRSGLQIVQKEEKVPSPFFRAGERIPESGVYRVFHPEHRVSHEVTLVSGQEFPRCSSCATGVHFELIHAAPEIDLDKNFRSRRLFEIPHPEENEEHYLDGQKSA
jgi:hypothetical protein